MRFLLFAVLAFLTAFTGCSSAAHKRDTKTFPAGDKVSVDHLTYSIIDTEIQPQLGDETSESGIYADIPLSFVHERIMDAGAPALEGAAPALMDKSPAALQNPGAKPGPGDAPQKK